MFKQPLHGHVGDGFGLLGYESSLQFQRPPLLGKTARRGFAMVNAPVVPSGHQISQWTIHH